MGTNPLEAGDLGRKVAKILQTRREELDLSPYRIAAMTGISRMRITRTLSGERPMLVDELDLIADALGLVGWRVLREAEEALAPLAEVRDLSELRARVESGQAHDVAALEPGYDPDMEQEPESP